MDDKNNDLRRRWGVLAGLVLIRTVVGFEFQSLGSVSASIPPALGFEAATLGAAVGAFMLPGVLISIPAGAASARWRDKTVLLFFLGVMFLGALGTAVFSTAAEIGVARLIAGAGAAGANVLLSKIVIDLFDGRSVQTAMGLLIASWPLGLGLSLAVLGPLAAHSGWQAGLIGSAVGCLLAVGVCACLRMENPPLPPGAKKAETRQPIDASTRMAVLLSGAIWALFNGALATILTFAPSLITRSGSSAAAGAALVGGVMWIVTLLIPIGGFLADRANNLRLIVVWPLLILAVCSPFLLKVSNPQWSLLLFGALCAIPAAAIASMPASVLNPAQRAEGMGLYQTVYYLGMFALPILGGFGDHPAIRQFGPLGMAGLMFAAASVLAACFRSKILSTGSNRSRVDG